jgi:hypothetical protein
VDDPFDNGTLPEGALEPPPPPRTGPSCGQVLGGCIEVVLIALIFVMLCGLISGAGVFFGQQRGVLAAEPPKTTPTPIPGFLDTVPTVAPLNVPTLPAEPAAERTLEAPEVNAAGTPVAACADGAAWWFSQQATFTSAASALAEATISGGDPAAVRLRLAPQRDALDAEGAPTCLEEAHAALLQGLDAALAGLDAARVEDIATVQTQSAAVTAALADTLTTLWDRGVFTTLDAATTRQVARGSAGDCAPEDWYAELTALWAGFNEQAATAQTASAITRNLAIGQMNALTEQATALEAPACVRDVQALATGWMTSTTGSLRALAAGDSATEQAAAAQAAQTAVLLRAWLDWVGLPAL